MVILKSEKDIDRYIFIAIVIFLTNEHTVFIFRTLSVQLDVPVYPACMVDPVPPGVMVATDEKAFRVNEVPGDSRAPLVMTVSPVRRDQKDPLVKTARRVLRDLKVNADQ